MDLVFQRYSSPLFFLDYCIENGNFNEAISFLYEQKQEEKYWDMYLATLPLNEKSYIDWKNEVQGRRSNNNDNSNYTKEDMDTVIKNSQDILSGFKPPQ